MTCAVESSAYRIHRSPPLGVCRRCHAMPCMHSTTVHNLPSRSYIRFDPPPCKKSIHFTRPDIIDSLNIPPYNHRNHTFNQQIRNTIKSIQQRHPHQPLEPKMTLTDANRCQICGDALFHDDVYSDPSQHFCISVDGPAMTNPPHVKSNDDQVRRTSEQLIKEIERPLTQARPTTRKHHPKRTRAASH
jgi:hypothetical protein